MANESEIYQTAIEAVIAASKVVLGYWPNPANEVFNPALKYEVFEKEVGVGNYATSADKAAGAVIRQVLRASPATRNHNIFSEDTPDEDRGSVYTDIADEIDGTISFNNGNYVFCVSLGVQREGEPIIGVLAAPTLGRLVAARENQGAFVMDFSKRVLAQVQPLPPDYCPPLDRLFIAYDLGYENRAGQLTTLAAPIADRVNNVVSYSSSCFANFQLAQGGVSASFFEKLYLPDMAGAVPIIEEVGGMVTDLEGKPIDWSKPYSSFLAARTPRIHQAVQELLHQ